MFRCIGCDRKIGWDGKGTFSYTCLCGARVLYDGTLERTRAREKWLATQEAERILRQGSV